MLLMLMLIVILYIDAPDLSAAFSELASKVSECPSATRGIIIINVTTIIIIVIVKIRWCIGYF